MGQVDRIDVLAHQQRDGDLDRAAQNLHICCDGDGGLVSAADQSAGIHADEDGLPQGLRLEPAGVVVNAPPEKQRRRLDWRES